MMVQKLKKKQAHPCVRDSPNHPRDTRVKVILVATPLLTPFAQICAGANMVYSRAERVFSHLNRLLLFAKHLATRILTRKYHILQQYTD
jgi:hypothetical protein